MPKAGKKLYAVQAGRAPGVYETWDDCKRQTDGFPGCKYKSFATATEAHAFAFPGSAFPLGEVKIIGSGIASTSKKTSMASARLTKPYEGKTRKAPASFNALASTEVDETEWDVVYTDGACKNNQGGGAEKRAGVGVWWGTNDERNIAVRCPGEQTNNRAELLGIILALETAARTKKPLMIKTDSKYSIQCFETWMHTWIARGWKTADGKIPANLSLIRYASALLDERAHAGQKVRLVHVRGHVGVVGNEGADDLANKGCWLSEVSEERDWSSLERIIRERLDGTTDEVNPLSKKVTEGKEVELRQVKVRAV